MTIRTALSVGLLCFGILAACGGDNAAPLPTSCTGAGCECTGAACTCIAGADCKAECGELDCGFTCSAGAKCNGQGTGDVDLLCQESSECKTNSEAGTIRCEDSSTCDVKTDATSAVTCTSSSNCKLNLGPGSTVACSDSADCNVKCYGDCEVTCMSSASCTLTCGPVDAAGESGTMCPDGRLVCGSC